MARKTKAAEEAVAEPVEGEVLTEEQAQAPADAVVVSETTVPTNPKRRLTTIATNIRKEFGKGIDAQFAIGHLLLEARTLLPSNQEFGTWFAAQEFNFSQPTAHRLAAAAEREPEVREFIEHSGRNGRDIGVTSAVKELTAGPKAEGDEELQATGKRVRDLMEDEPEPGNGFAQWRTATENLNLQTLTVEELGAFAVLIQTLVAAYGEERTRRSA